MFFFAITQITTDVPWNTNQLVRVSRTVNLLIRWPSLLIQKYLFTSTTVSSKQVWKEVGCRVILPATSRLVFPGRTINNAKWLSFFSHSNWMNIFTIKDKWQFLTFLQLRNPSFFRFLLIKLILRVIWNVYTETSSIVLI